MPYFLCYCLSLFQIRVSISYSNRIDTGKMDAVFDSPPPAKENASNSDFVASDSRKVGEEDKPYCFTSSVDINEQMLSDSAKPTHINLLVYPIASISRSAAETLVPPPATLCFEVAAASKLLPPLDKKNPVIVDIEQLLK